MVGSKRSRPGGGVSSGSSLVRLGRLTTSKTDSSLVRCRSFVSKYPLIRCVSVELDSDDEEDATTLKHLNPWKRRHVKQQTNDLVHRCTHYHNPKHTFQKQESNLDLDIHTKRPVLKLSPSVVAVTSYQGGNQVFWGSGVIFECFWENDSFCCSVLTSATLLKPPPPHTCFHGLFCSYRHCSGNPPSDTDEPHLTIDGKIDVCLKGGRICEGAVVASDPHYNFAVLNFKSDDRLPCAVLRPFNDVPTNSKDCAPCFSYAPLTLIPGDGVIAVGRYSSEPFEIMAAPGKYSAHSFGKNSKLDCMELLSADCKITKRGIGGPLICRTGEVIGINFYDGHGTPFLPINIFLKWWSHYRVTGSHCRPSLGMQVANLGTAKRGILDLALELGISQGLVIEKVLSGSPAETCGIRPGDIIIKCSATTVSSSLQLFDIIWDLVGKAVEVVLVRDGSHKNMKIEVKDITSEDELYKWLLPRCTIV